MRSSLTTALQREAQGPSSDNENDEDGLKYGSSESSTSSLSSSTLPPVAPDRISGILADLPSSGVTLFSNPSAPNGHKVAIILSELGIEYRTVNLDMSRGEQRSPHYVALNPSGRIPTIIDHDNDDFVLWESGAILIYLCERNAPVAIERGLWSESLDRRAEISQWLFFQATGHAPMVGQALHFQYQQGNDAAATQKFLGEVRRLYGVLEVRLAEQREDRPEADAVWLVGDDITAADLAFTPWNLVLDRLGISLISEFPEVAKWTAVLRARPTVRRALV